MDIKLINSIFGVIFGLFLISFQNCSKAHFVADPNVSSLNSTNGGDDSTCRPNTMTSNKIIKVLFVVDTSGSNAGANGTDLNKRWRSETITDFINQYSGKTNFHYGLITFQGSSAKGHILVNGTAGFSNDMTVVQSGYDSFMNTADSGSTPYKAALLMAKNTISADLAANPAQKASYVMLMISDGQAKDYSSPDQVIPDAKAIVAVAPEQVALNSVYYYSSAFDDSQTTYLRNISTVGKGSFIVANSNQVLSVNDVIQLPPTNCQ